ncbi:transposase, IS605 OrfB family protein [Halorubrum distributum JCM 9100]|uniref:Transposase, IS605 OrfB family protein n=2 Tax=Halorubrum distributum TaxID=29283 RepID=M0EMZ4_9EURY|nr:RNA-guided endonuclease TnpB family protein [Halorubrum distributum]ELZ49085.1 transposase, IS605 OrfB family protein [Halorubrum distributum JCM 9100]ELZ52137.1 transposase, IS605 OrfB family protein [Halorubrum distributum JCM 10118]MDV7350379.1 transposase [Halorubrum distributum]
MYYGYKYRLNPPEALTETLLHHVDTCRQLYNHVLYKLNETDEIPARYKVQGQLPDLKSWWDDLNDVHSKVLQMVVKRVYDNLSTLRAQKENGRAVGMLKWKPPQEYRSLTYNQSGFELKNTSGRPVLRLSKIGEIPIHLHRDIPENATIKQVTVKREPTGEWYATFGIDVDEATSEKPENPRDVVGIDVGIVKYAHDTDGTAVESPDFSDERERLERAQRNLSRKERGSNNWEDQREMVARRHADLKRKRRDFLHKLSNYYAREYDLVAVEDLDAKGLIELPGNSRNRAGASWGTFLRMLEYKCEREGTHFVAVDPGGTTKECASCGTETDKPLWVREHSCPSCGFVADRDANASWNILSRGLDKVGVGHSESPPVETALPTDTTSVSAKRVVETGSPTLKERTASAVSE